MDNFHQFARVLEKKNGGRRRGVKNISGYVPYYKDRDELKFANIYRDKNVY